MHTTIPIPDETRPSLLVGYRAFLLSDGLQRRVILVPVAQAGDFATWVHACDRYGRELRPDDAFDLSDLQQVVRFATTDEIAAVTVWAAEIRRRDEAEERWHAFERSNPSPVRGGGQ